MKILTVLSIALMCMGASLEAKSYYRLDRTPYTDYRAFKTGDLLTLNVNESATTSNDSTIDDKKEDGQSWNLDKTFFPAIDMAKGFQATMGEGDKPGIGMSSNYEFKSSGKRTTQHQFSTRMQVQIVEVLSEGVFFVRGSKQVDINGKMKNIFVSGKVREHDIVTFDDETKLKNKIEVYNLADAIIQINDEILTNDGEASWFSKTLKKIFY